MIQTASREKWESRNKFKPAVSEACIDTGHIIVEQLQESGTHPLIAIHGILYAYMAAGASCKLDRAQLQELISDNADDLYALAVENVQFASPVGEDVSEQVDGIYTGVN